MCMWGNGNFPLIYYITQEAPKEYYFRFKILPSLNEVSLKISCLFLTESSHDNVESSRYVLCDRSHMLTIEINLNFGRRYGPKKTDNAKICVPLMLVFGCIVLWCIVFGCIVFGCIVFERRVGQYFMCVKILLYYIYRSRMTNSPVFLNEETQYLTFVKPICL